MVSSVVAQEQKAPAKTKTKRILTANFTALKRLRRGIVAANERRAFCSGAGEDHNIPGLHLETGGDGVREDIRDGLAGLD